MQDPISSGGRLLQATLLNVLRKMTLNVLFLHLDL